MLDVGFFFENLPSSLIPSDSSEQALQRGKLKTTSFALQSDTQKTLTLHLSKAEIKHNGIQFSRNRTQMEKNMG